MNESTNYGLPIHVLTSLKKIFLSHRLIEQVLLYGSRAKGNFRLGSDIDLCIVGPQLSTHELLAIETQIEELLLPWKVDLSLKHQIENADLLDHINRVGIRLL